MKSTVQFTVIQNKILFPPYPTHKKLCLNKNMPNNNYFHVNCYLKATIKGHFHYIERLRDFLKLRSPDLITTLTYVFMDNLKLSVKKKVILNRKIVYLIFYYFELKYTKIKIFNLGYHMYSVVPKHTINSFIWYITVYNIL